MGRKRLSNGQKLKFLEEMDTRRAAGESLKSIAWNLGVEPAQLRRWNQVRDRLASTLTRKKSIHRGRTSVIKHLEEQIIGYALVQQALGVSVSYKLLQIKACQLSEDFRNKLIVQQHHIVRRLAISNCLVDCVVTYQSQRRPEDMIEAAQEWLATV